MGKKGTSMTKWQEVKLGDVCDLIAGFAFKSSDFGSYPDKVIKITIYCV